MPAERDGHGSPRPTMAAASGFLTFARRSAASRRSRPALHKAARSIMRLH